MHADYPVRFSVEYPDRPLNRVTTAFRLFTVIPIAIVLAAIGGYSATYGDAAQTTTVAVGGIGLLFLPPLLMILFRQKYPRWWFDWNLELLRFTNRVGAYFALLDDRYPSTDEQQSVRLDLDYPDAKEGSTDGFRWSSGYSPFRTTSSCFSSQSARPSRRSVPGSRSSSPVATRAVSSTTSRV